MAWPPTLDALKTDMNDRENIDDRDNTVLQVVLDAAVAFVQRVHAGRYNFAGDLGNDLPPDPPDDLVLGTLRLAARLHNRRRSPNGTVDMGDLGTARIAGNDPDIARLLRIGRHAPPVVG